MELKVIDSRVYEDARRRLEKFVKDIKESCDSQPKINEIWLYTQAVYLLLRISKRTLQYYRDAAILPYKQIGNQKYFYKKTDVARLIKDSEIKKPENDE